MKRLLLFSALVAASVLNVFAYDFSSVAPNGQTLYYAILNSSEVSVVFPSSTYTMDPYECSGTWTGFAMPTGNLVIPDTVVYNGTPYRVAVIEQGAFYGCTGLTSITIPRSVTTIRALGFWNCTGVTSVFFNAEYCTTDGLYFTGAFEGDTNIASITFGDSVRIIPEFLCYGLSRLTSATFAQAVTTIHNYAFTSCRGLTSVSLPTSITFIGDAAFSQCSGLTSVVMPSSITAIHDMAFYNCSGLTSVTLPPLVTNIGVQCFYGCSGLTSIVLPASVASIGANAFENCTGLTEIYSQDTVAPTLGVRAFQNVSTTIPIYIPCGSRASYTSPSSPWNYFSNFVEEGTFAFTATSSDEQQGTVQIRTMPSCTHPQAEVYAAANRSFRFDHWSDGSTANPYTLTVTCDTALVAYFDIADDPDGISATEVDNIGVYAAEGRIYVTLGGQTTDEFSVYDVMGRHVAHVIASDKSPVVPAGVYIVKVGMLPARKVVIR